jgi:hypothetical protein
MKVHLHWSDPICSFKEFRVSLVQVVQLRVLSKTQTHFYLFANGLTFNSSYSYCHKCSSTSCRSAIPILWLYQQLYPIAVSTTKQLWLLLEALFAARVIELKECMFWKLLYTIAMVLMWKHYQHWSY